MSMQMEMDLRTPKKQPKKNPPFDSTKHYVLYGHGIMKNGKFVEHTEAEIVHDYVRQFRQPPEYIRRDGGGWTLGPVPEAEVKSRREGREDANT